jgi:hypothetical protein
LVSTISPNKHQALTDSASQAFERVVSHNEIDANRVDFASALVLIVDRGDVGGFIVSRQI